MVVRCLVFVLFLVGCYVEGPVPQELDLRPVGLFTDPNPHSGAPKGALRTADNVVLRRDGVLQPRPGFEEGTSGGLDWASSPQVLIPFDGELLVVGEDSGDAVVEWADAGSEVTTNGSDALEFDSGQDHVAGAEARGNLYLTTTDTVRKLESSSDVEAGVVGSAPTPSILPTITASGDVLDQYGGRGYRVAIQRTDSNNVVVTSAPSVAVVAQTTGAMGANVTVKTPLLASHQAGDVVLVYRTPQVGGSASANGLPGAEYFLIHEYELTSSEISAGHYTFTDTAADSEAGAALYTNPSQEGILQQNDRPHTAKDLAYFRGSLFLANTRGPHRIQLSLTDDAIDQTGNATGIGTRTISGTRTASSANITGLAAVVGLKVGMIISDITYFPAGTRIASISGVGPYTVTATNVSSGTATGNIQFVDSIRVKTGALEDKYYPVVDNAGLIDFVAEINGTNIIAGDGASTYHRAYVAHQIVYDVVYQPQVTGRILIEEINRAGNSFEVFATHGDEYAPVLPEPTEADGTASAADIRPNGIQWSKTDQPEHVPEANFATVGTEAEILRIIPTKDALFVFKKDGIWRLTGNGATAGWRIDPVDRSTFLLNPRSVVVMSGRIYAWTNRGVVRVNDYGVGDEDIVSKLAVGTDLRALEKDLSDYSSDTGGAWLCANEKDDELLVGVPSAQGDDESNDVYAYNTKTRAWTTWDRQYSHAVVRPDDGLIWAAHRSGGTLHKERRGTIENADLSYSVTINDVTSTTITIAGGSGWTPAVGDLLDQSDDLARVVSVTSATVFAVDMTGLSTGGATAYDAFTSEIEHIVKTGGSPGALKNFMQVSAMFDDLINVRKFTLSFTSNLSATAESQDREFTRALESTQPRSEYFLVPQNAAIVSHLWPKLSLAQAGAAWEFTGLTLTYELLSPLTQYSETTANLEAAGGGGG